MLCKQVKTNKSPKISRFAFKTKKSNAIIYSVAMGIKKYNSVAAKIYLRLIWVRA